MLSHIKTLRGKPAAISMTIIGPNAGYMFAFIAIPAW
jgi:hypothetical protein